MAQKRKTAKRKPGVSKAVSVAYVAAIQEFGYRKKKIPARPIIRPVMKKNRVKYKNLAKELAKQILHNGLTLHDALETLGLVVAGDFKEQITLTHTPALKESTVKARQRALADGKTVGSLTKPLVAIHKLLLNTVTNVVVNE